jgi:hypothetical protein
MALIGNIKRENENSIGSNFISYPKELGTMERSKHYVMFFINVQTSSKIDFEAKNKEDAAMAAHNSKSGYSPPKSKTSSDGSTLTLKRAPTKRLSQSIALYMPAQLNMSQKAGYGEAEIGVAVANVMAGYDAVQSDASFNELAKRFIGQGENIVKDMATGALDAVAAGAKAARDISQGRVRNNRSEMVFEGIDRRSFAFTFKMLPTSAAEAQAIEDIVTAFRYHAMPEIDGSDPTGRTMTIPSTFDIEYHPNTHLHKISTSVLESVDIQYGGERVQFFTDDQPVETQLTLNFKELEIITKKRIMDGF